ncbi:MAG: DUF177 domain-containing protein [Alphaproteobacteria bacterium]|nr:DUF177 domain-containing protein [Alphaproteobacteria bacterium]
MTDTLTLAATVAISDLDKEGKTFELAGTPEELERVAERFELVSVSALSGSLVLKDKGPEQGVLVSGKLAAQFTQKCIATLAPVDEELETDFELLLVDPEMADRMDEEGVYLDADAPEYDALEGEIIPIGEILAQTLSISMNPYPRAEGVELSAGSKSGITVNEPELERPNPFAVLAKTRDES